jgi:hypothetical protein
VIRELMSLLSVGKPSLKLTTEELWKALDASMGSRKPPKWPANPRSLSVVLRRFSPILRRMGWTIEQDGQHPREWNIARPREHPRIQAATAI